VWRASRWVGNNKEGKRGEDWDKIGIGMSNVAAFSLELISWGPLSSQERERKIRRRVFTSSIKREIRHIYVIVVPSVTAKKCTKMRDTRARLLFSLLFWPSRWRRRCRRLSSAYDIVSRGVWFKPANIKVENNGAVVYVGSSLTVHNPLFSVHKLWLNKLMQCFYWSESSKW